MNGVGFLGRQNGRGSGGGFNGNHGRPLGGGNNVAMGAEVVNGLGKKKLVHQKFRRSRINTKF
jgi:hypothetical protein